MQQNAPSASEGRPCATACRWLHQQLGSAGRISTSVPSGSMLGASTQEICSKLAADCSLTVMLLEAPQQTNLHQAAAAWNVSCWKLGLQQPAAAGLAQTLTGCKRFNSLLAAKACMCKSSAVRYLHVPSAFIALLKLPILLRSKQGRI